MTMRENYRFPSQTANSPGRKEKVEGRNNGNKKKERFLQ